MKHLYLVTAAPGKAADRILAVATAVKKELPESKFVLAVTDSYPVSASGAIDECVSSSAIQFGTDKHWLFKRSHAEVAPYFKLSALKQCLAKIDCWGAIAIDAMRSLPTIDAVAESLRDRNVVVVPRVGIGSSEESMEADMAALRDGCFESNVYGISATAEGQKFAAWLQERLGESWADEKDTLNEQRWLDLVPALVENFGMAVCNIADAVKVAHEPAWQFDCFDNGERVRPEHRKFLRDHAYLKDTFADPFDTTGTSFLAWFNAQNQPADAAVNHSFLRRALGRINDKVKVALGRGGR